MIQINKIKNAFDKYGGVLKTSELKDLGLSSQSWAIPDF